MLLHLPGDITKEINFICENLTNLSSLAIKNNSGDFKVYCLL